MNIPNIANNIGFSPRSKVWAYVAERPLNPEEEASLDKALKQFATQWTAHNAALKAHSEVFAHQLILLVVDETQAGASGCSIDKSVRFLETQSEYLGIDLFDRMRFGWIDQAGSVRFDTKQKLSELKEQGTIGPDTPMLNTLAATLHDIRENWSLPYSASWHNRVF